MDPGLPRYAEVRAYLLERAGYLDHAAERYAEAARAATNVPEHNTSLDRTHGCSNYCGRESDIRPHVLIA